MAKKTRSALTGLVLAMLAGNCAAQNETAKSPEPLKWFRLDFALKEVENGKLVNTRNYSIMVPASRKPDVEGNGSIRTGEKVPVKTGGQASGPQYTYIDVGVNIDCRELAEVQGRVSLSVVADISAASETPLMPVIRNTKWSSTNVTVPLRRATVLFTADSSESKRQMQLELTATPVL